MSRATWSNKYAVLRDLTEVTQGHVPVNIEGSLHTTENAPPMLLINEEIEDEFFHQGGGGGNNEAPDLNSIREMIEMVKDNLEPTKKEIPKKEQLVIKKLNPHAREFSPSASKSEDVKIKRKSPIEKNNNLPEKVKSRKGRNAAINSIIASEELNTCQVQAKIVLLKPENFLTDATTSTSAPEINNNAADEISNKEKTVLKETKSVNKATNWLNVSGSSMFKRKENKTTSTDINMNNTQSANIIGSSIKTPPPSKYVPSPLAAEYYKKLVARSEVKHNVVETIWTRAEKQMKEIDETIKLAQMKAEEEAEAARIAELQAAEAEHAQENNIADTDRTFNTKEAKTTEMLHLSETEDELSATSLLSLSSEAEYFRDMKIDDLFDETQDTHCNRKQVQTGVKSYPPLIMLPQQRHLLTGECIVCAVLCKPKEVKQEPKTDNSINDNWRN